MLLQIGLIMITLKSSLMIEAYCVVSYSNDVDGSDMKSIRITANKRGVFNDRYYITSNCEHLSRNPTIRMTVYPTVPTDFQLDTKSIMAGVRKPSVASASPPGQSSKKISTS